MSAAGEVVVVSPDDASEGAGEHSDPGGGFAYSPVRDFGFLVFGSRIWFWKEEKKTTHPIVPLKFFNSLGPHTTLKTCAL